MLQELLLVSKYKRNQYFAEKAWKIRHLKPFDSLNAMNGKPIIHIWANPKLLKYSKWAGCFGAAGDFANLTGIGFNFDKDGYTTENFLDLGFGIVGFYPIAGDAISLYYMGAKWYLKQEIKMINESPDGGKEVIRSLDALMNSMP